LKKFVALVVFLALSVIFMPGLIPKAEASPIHKAVFVVNQNSYTVDGQEQTMDVAPFIENDRTYVPVRFLAQSLGCRVQWDESTRAVTLAGDKTVILVIGNTTLQVNGQSQTMDVAPFIENDRTFLPARFVAEAFGYVVSWDAATNTVTVAPPQQPVVQPTQPVGNVQTGPFKPPIKSLSMQVGQATATTDKGGTVDLGTAPVMVSIPDAVNYWKSKSPDVYREGTYIADPNYKGNTGIYVPFIPVAEAFGVPADNIQWDGKTLTVYQKPSIYWVYTPGSNQAMFTDTGAVTGKKFTGPVTIEQPLRVENGVPMMGMDQSLALLFPAVYSPGLTTGGYAGTLLKEDLTTGKVVFAWQ